MTFTFKFVDKQALGPVLPEVFKILRSNMERIAPSGDGYEEDLNVWSEYIVPAMREEQRQMVLMLCDGELAGYFQYNIREDAFIMEEIQIRPEYQGTGLFRKLYKWLEKELPTELVSVEAYANKNNLKSQKILEHLGLSRAGESKSGSSYYYKGSCWELLKSFK